MFVCVYVLMRIYRLNAQGYPLGLRLLDLLLSRTPTSSSQPPTNRPTRILSLLQFITTTLWRHLFNRPADALERSAANPAEYMITDNDPLVSQYVSVPKEIRDFNPGALVAGIVEGVCDGAGFSTSGVRGQGVSAHWAGEEGVEGGDRMWPSKTVFLIRFSPEVLEREEILARGGS
jgi:trafficking protein particle complex subunit 5